MVPRSIGMANDDAQERRTKISTFQIIPAIPCVRDECWKHKQAGGSQHDTTATNECQTGDDRLGYVCSAW